MVGHRVRVPVSAAVVALAAAVLSACTGSGNSSPSASPTATGPSVPTLAAAWKADVGTRFQRHVGSVSPPFWTTDSSVIVPLTAGLTSYAAATGARQWHLDLPQKVCAIAAAPNSDGIAAVLMGHGTRVNDEACSLAGAVDTRTGRLLWTRSIAKLSSYGFTDVAIGPRAVAVTNTCDAALTMSVTDGAVLVDKTPKRIGCSDSFASDGRILLDGQDHRAGRARLIGYDTVSGRRVLSVPLHGDAADPDANPELDRVVSSDPVIVDGRVDSHRFLQRIGDGRVTPFGRESGDSYPATFVHRVGSDMLVQYGQSQVLFDYDARSGHEVHHTVLDKAETAIGLRGGDVISVVAGGSALGSGALAVLSTDPSTGARRVLATTPLDGVDAYLGNGLGFDAAVAGRTLVVGTTDGVAAYALPARGVPASSVGGSVLYADHDIRPDTVADLCTGLSVSTRRELGFVHPTLPAPADCSFVEPERNHDIVQVTISVFTSAPRGKRSATSVAQSVVAGFSKADTTNHLPAATAVSGIGDEAFEVSSDTDHLQLARIVTRRANVTVYIDITNDGSNERPSELARLRRGARLAAQDMIATIDRRR